MYSLRNILLMCLLLPAFRGAAQDTSLVHQLLLRIASQQVIKEAGFTKGNFPSYVSGRHSFSKRKKDDNIFFAALIGYTLHRYYDSFSGSDKQVVDSILRRTTDLYPHFQNQKGRPSYAFWRTDTAFVFPYTWWIHHIKKNTALPDDMDDTVLSLMAQNADSARAAEAHAVMQNFINQNEEVKTIEKKYRSFKAYSVWYGEHFPAVLDVCVLSNLLSFVQQYHLAWTSADSAGLDVIVTSVKNEDYIRRPLYVSPYYGNTSIILYHLARLMSYEKIPQLEALKAELVREAVYQFNQTNHLLEKIILSSAIRKWKGIPPSLIVQFNGKTISHIEHNDLPFFTGNIPSYFPLFCKHLFTKEQWLLFYHYCPAFNDALLLEHLLLRQQK